MLGANQYSNMNINQVKEVKPWKYISAQWLVSEWKLLFLPITNTAHVNLSYNIESLILTVLQVIRCKVILNTKCYGLILLDLFAWYLNEIKPKKTITPFFHLIGLPPTFYGGPHWISNRRFTFLWCENYLVKIGLSFFLLHLIPGVKGKITLHIGLSNNAFKPCITRHYCKPQT